MIVFESMEYQDEDGDAVSVECCDTHVEIMVWSTTGCWVGSNPKVLRDIAAQLTRGAEELERKETNEND